MKVILFSLLMSAMLVGSVTESKAQCPPGTWNGLFVARKTVDGCTVDIGYCWRPYGTSIQLIIEYVASVGFCGTLPDQLIGDAGKALVNDGNIICSITGIPSCSSGTTKTFEYLQAKCWKHVHSDGVTHPYWDDVWVVCDGGCGTDSYPYCACILRADLCCDNSTTPPTPIYANEAIGYTGAYFCDPQPTPPDPWEWDHCYHVSCLQSFAP